MVCDMAVITGRLVGASSPTALPTPTVGQVVENVTTLRALVGSSAMPAVTLRQYSETGANRGGGVFMWDAVSRVDDGVLRFNAGGLASSAAGWQRVETSPITVQMAGAAGDGVVDDTAAIQRALAAGAGGRVFVPAGEYRITAAIDVPANTELFGGGYSSWLRQYTVGLPAVRTTASRVTVRALRVRSEGDGILITTNAAGVLYPRVENVEVDGIGDGFSGLKIYAADNWVYFPTVTSPMMNGGNAAPSVGTRKGIRIEADPTYAVIGATVFGGRLTNFLHGVSVAGSSVLTKLFGTAFDGMTDGASNGRAIYCGSGCYALRAVELESEPYPAVDALVEFVSDSSDNRVEAHCGGAAPGWVIDAGVRNETLGSDGSGGLIDTCKNPLWFVSAPRVGSGGARLFSGAGSPEGVVAGSVGDVYHRTDGGSGTTLYGKESGAATNTGWVAYGAIGLGLLAPGSESYSSGQWHIQYQRLQLTGTQRLTLAGTARYILTDL